MRILKSLVAVTAVAAAASALAIAPAMADPVNSHLARVTPSAFDVVGVGSDTIESVLDALSVSYNSSHKVDTPAHPHIYSWDATPPNNPTNLTSVIQPKAGCSAKTPRPDGSGAGITALTLGNAKDSRNKAFKCFDFARSSRGRAATDPPKSSKTGINFVVLAKDAVTWSTGKVSNAPKTLTAGQLKGIYSCTIKTWGQVPGSNPNAKTKKIEAVLPQSGSGTRSFFLTAIGGSSFVPGACVNSTPEENEGVNAVFKKNPGNIVFPFSIGKYIAQKFHSAACGKKPGKGQNQFGCNAVGNLVLRSVTNQAHKVTAPTVGTGVKTTINPSFAANFQRLVYDVVPSGTTANRIPSRLQPFFNPATTAKGKVSGYFCGATARKILVSYGFLPTPECGIGL